MNDGREQPVMVGELQVHAAARVGQPLHGTLLYGELFTLEATRHVNDYFIAVDLRALLTRIGYLDVHRMQNQNVIEAVGREIQRGTLAVSRRRNLSTGERGFGEFGSPESNSPAEAHKQKDVSDEAPAPSWWPFGKHKNIEESPAASGLEHGRDPSAISQPPDRLKQAYALVHMQGTADERDVALVAAELAKMPSKALQLLQDSGVSVIVCRGSITEYRKDLAGVRPRGWPPGSSWDAVPGLYSFDRKEVVIATIAPGPGGMPRLPQPGESHGSHNLVLHETAHAIDDHTSRSSSSSGQDFCKAYETDKPTLSDYESQSGPAGNEEAYAESAARYYGGDPLDRDSHPNLHGFWERAFRD